MIYVYIIRVMKGSAGGNRPTRQHGKDRSGTDNRDPRSCRQAGSGGVSLPSAALGHRATRHGASVRGLAVGFDESARIQGRCRGLAAGRTLRRLRGETRTGALPDREFARQLRLQEEEGK